MKLRHLLHVVDFSKGFMLPGRVLYVQDAEKTINPANDFVQKATFSYAILTNDTHFVGEYKHSLEAGAFPFHQGYGTTDHEYLIDIHNVNAIESYFMLKNKFDAFAENSDVAVPFEEIEFASAEEARIYKGLYHMADVSKGYYDFGMHFQEYLDKLYETGHRDVVLFGHATDYCVRDAILGYLERGFTVYLIEDLCRGIWNTDLLGGVANIQELIARCPDPDYVNGTVTDRTVFQDAAAKGQLIVTNTKEYLAKYNNV